MKNTLSRILLAVFVLAAALISPSVAAFAVERPDNVVTKEYPFDSFKGIDVSGAFEVTLTKGPYKLTVEVPEDYVQYLRIRISRDVLCIGMDNVPRAIFGKLTKIGKQGSDWFKVYVSMPTVESVSMSGATTLESSSTFDVDDFRMEASGAANIKNIVVNGKALSLDASGASKVNLEGSFTSAKVECSGSVRANLDIKVPTLNASFSGSSKGSFKLDADSMKVGLTGASSLSATGDCDNLRVEGSGAASLDCLSIPLENASVQLSGASSCKLNVGAHLDVSLSGASSCQYKGGCDVEIVNVGRGSQLKKLGGTNI